MQGREQAAEKEGGDGTIGERNNKNKKTNNIKIILVIEQY